MTNNFKVNYIGANPYDKIGSALQRYYRYSDRLYHKSIHNEFDIMGVKSVDEIDSFIEERMVELNKNEYCVGEIVRYPIAVGYREISLSMDENCIGTSTNEDLLKRTLFNMAYNRVKNTLNTRYVIVKVDNDNISYIEGSDNFETVKSMVFSLVNPEIDDCDYDSIYYIRDMVKDEFHKCSCFVNDFMGEIVKESNACRIILPLYEYVCYGHI